MTAIERSKAPVQRLLAQILIIAMMLTLAVLVPSQTPAAQAQGDTSDLVVWGASNSTWKFSQANIGSATAAQLNFDDSSWGTRDLRWREVPGAGVGNHFRKEFDLAAILSANNLNLFNVVGIKVQIQYDDAAVMYLNEQEVYRSIRGNLDWDYSTYAPGADIPASATVSWGGVENRFVHIPNVPCGEGEPNAGLECLGGNYNNREIEQCSTPSNTCAPSPYAAQGFDDYDVPAICSTAEECAEILIDGTNLFAVTTWNQSGGGSGDSSLNHAFTLVIDDEALPPIEVSINEVQSKNQTTLADGDGDFPDWIELRNEADSPVDIGGWTIGDSTATWEIPANTTIGAKDTLAGGQPADYVVVFASDKGDPDDADFPGPAGELHANFKLSSEGDSVKLVTADGFVADEYFAMPRMDNDFGYGRASDYGDLAYLGSATPLAPNTPAGTSFAPVLRPFANRLYNVGEDINEEVEAFDPDGDALTYLMGNVPNLSIDSAGLITGTAIPAGTFTSTLRVIDGDAQVTASPDPIVWRFIAAPSRPPGLVLNEYNGVADDRELLGGGGDQGNGGDWFEFLVVEDNLDLRGWRIEIYDRKGKDDNLRQATELVFADRMELSAVPAGTLIVIGEEVATHFGFNGLDDWTISINVGPAGESPFFEPPPEDSIFNSTRSSNTVLIRDAQGNIASPLSGETEAWDYASGGVSGQEVMNLCVNPTADAHIDPIDDYRDNNQISSRGLPNQCRYTVLADPNDPLSGVQVEFDQNLAALRNTATFGAGSGDVDCDGQITIQDARIVTQYAIGLITTTDAPCLFDFSGGKRFINGGNVDGFPGVTINDSRRLTQCAIGLAPQLLPGCFGHQPG